MTARRYALEFAPKAIRSLGKFDRPVAEESRRTTDDRLVILVVDAGHCREIYR